MEWKGRLAGVEGARSRMLVGTGDKQHVPDPGLCRSCANVRRIESDRKSVFIMCNLSFEDSRFPKYPRLPVTTCSGYRPSAAV